VFESAVVRIERERVTLRTPAGQLFVSNDSVIALIGGIPSWALVASAGVKMARS
jgi:hypothetical protein